jgi:hypothetical protein
MTTTANSRTRRTLMTIKRVWNEMDHAQRRLIELRTGQSINR